MGGCHGALQIIENILFGKSTKRKKSIVHVIITFILCSFVWTFFKANTVVEAVHMITHCLDGILLPRYYIMTGLVAMNISTITILEIGFFIVLLFIYDLFSVKRDCIEWFSKKPIAIRWMIYIIVVLMIVVLQPEVGGGFIYFQF